MVLHQGNAQILREVGQTVALHFRHQNAGQFEGVDEQVVQWQPLTVQEAQVDIDRVADDRVALDKG